MLTKGANPVGAMASANPLAGPLVPTRRSRDAAAALIDDDLGTFILCEQMSPSVSVVEASLVGQPEPTQAITRMRLFFVIGVVQALPMWILADSGSARNLISREAFNDFAFQPPLRLVRDVKVVGRSGEFLDLKGFAVIPITIMRTVIWHEFGVMKRLPLAALIGGDILAPHQFSLNYVVCERKRLRLGATDYPVC